MDYVVIETENAFNQSAAWDSEFWPVDTVEEIEAARAEMTRRGIDALPVYRGEEGDSILTSLVLVAKGE